MRPSPRFRPLVRSLALLSSACALGAGLACAADGSTARWRVLEAPRFRVISQLDDAATQAWAGEFNQFLDALGDMVPADESALAPLEVVLFERDADFAAYKPQAGHGKRANHVGGFFAQRETWSVIGLSDRGGDTQTRETIFHEGVHWYTSTAHGVHPVWYDEGLADALSTFRIEDGQAVWGASPASYREFMQEHDPLPLDAVLTVRRGDALLDDEVGAARFYVRSWAFVHHELFGEAGSGRTVLRDYLDALGRGEGVSEAFVRVFDRDTTGMNRSLDAYVADEPDVAVRRPFESPGIDGTGPTIRPAQAVEVETALARLALGAGQYEEAGVHVNRLLDEAPDQVVGYELGAVLSSETGDGDTALAISARAVEMGSKDAAIYMILGEQNFRVASAGGELAPEHARGIANIFLHAIKLRPTMRSAYRNLARLVCSLEKVTDRDLSALAAGAQLFPDEGEIPLGLAILALQRGDSSEATRLLAEALKPAADLSAEAREAARALAAQAAS